MARRVEKKDRNQIQDNNCNHRQEHQLQSGHMGIKHETITPTVIVPVQTEKEQSFKIRTLLDSGSSANWITRDMLQFVKQ